MEPSQTEQSQLVNSINLQTEQSQTEQSQLVNSVNLQTEQSQTEQSQTEQSQTEQSQSEQSQTVNSFTEKSNMIYPKVTRYYTRRRTQLNSEHSQKETVNSNLDLKMKRNCSKKVSNVKRKENNKRGSKSKTNQNTSIDLENGANEEEINLRNLESTDQLLTSDLNVESQMELIEFINQNRDSNKKVYKSRSNNDKQHGKNLAAPIQTKQTNQQLDREERQLFELANQLIELSNKLVEPKAMNKLSAEDKSDICNGIRKVAEKLFDRSNTNEETNDSSSDESGNMEVERNDQTGMTQTQEKRAISPADSLCSLNNIMHLNKRSRMETPETENIFRNCFEQTEENKKYDERIQDKLRRTRIVNVMNPKDYIELKGKIETNEEFLNGKMNIREFTCNANGKISIECDKPKEIPTLEKILDSLGHKYKAATSSKFLFRIPGIPAELSNENFIDQISRRDKRFKDRTLFCIVDRFKLDNCRDTIVLQVLNPLKKQLKENRHIFIGFKKYKISKHYKLVQCFKCSEFGHNADFCEKKPSCSNCAGKHNLKDCSRNFIPKCTNCIKNNCTHTNHSSWSVECPYREQYKLWLKERANNNGW